MTLESRPLRSTRRLSNRAWDRPAWYSIANSATTGPVLVTIYDEIGFYGVSAGQFMADLDGITGPIEMHINSPGGDIYDGITIYNRLKARGGDVHVIVDGLAASAASFIAMAASPGQLEMAPHSEMMIHNGFTMAIGDAADLRKTADLLDKKTADIADMYAQRSGKPAAYWLGKMQAETWYSAEEAVAEGLADRITGQSGPSNGWDLSVYANYAGTLVNAAPSVKCPACSKFNKADAKTCASCGAAMPAQGQGDEAPAEAPGSVPATSDATGTRPQNAAAEPVQLGDGWVEDPDGTVRFDPDGDGDNDATPAGDTDHDYFDEDGNQVKPIPPCPGPALADSARFPLLASVDNSPWDASKAWHNGAMSDDPAAFYKGICAGRKAGDPANQSSWALPYKYHPGDPVNAAGVKAALSRLPDTEGLTNAAEAKATLQAAMKQVNPDYDPDALAASPALLASMFTLPAATVDDSQWNPAAAMAAAAASSDPEAFYRGICAGRRPGDPSTPQAWALPYRYAPTLPPNSSGVRSALAELSTVKDLANPGEARSALEKAMREVSPGTAPDNEMDPLLLAAVFNLGLEGAGK